MAAAARASGPADARIPCPLCNGLIHPIAGRCKHCKGDVSATRSARPAATALPPLLGPSAPAQPQPVVAPPFANGHANGANRHAPVPAPAPIHPANQYLNVPIAVGAIEDSRPILPPRQTGRMPASAASSGAWKSWPVVVIAIAVLAIITAVILMVWPPGGAPPTDAKTLAPPPAPERMDTNPLPSTGNGPSGSIDPWKAPGAPDPGVTPPLPPTSPDIDDIDPSDPGSLRDPFASRGGNPLGRNPFGGNSQAMLGLFTAAAKHACDRLAACPSANDPTVKSMCDISRLAMPSAPVPTCAAAQRCLATIDRMPCDDLDTTSLGMAMVTGIQDCLEAMRC